MNGDVITAIAAALLMLLTVSCEGQSAGGADDTPRVPESATILE